MSRKHYNAIASVLREIEGEMNGEAYMWLADQLAAMFAEDNPLFDKERWDQAVNLAGDCQCPDGWDTSGGHDGDVCSK